MSAVLGVVSAGGASPDEGVARRQLQRMRGRGVEFSAFWQDGAFVLGVGRYAWELGTGFSGAVLVLEEEEMVLVADASIYYRDDLRRKLANRGIRPGGDTPSHLILAAYRAWGGECARHLEGDFAFLLLDKRRRVLLCARDFSGRRPLFFAQRGDALIVASSVSAILEHPRCTDELNLEEVATIAAGLFGATYETCYRNISVLPAGCTLIWESGRSSLERHWEPPAIEPSSRLRFEDAAEELQRLLRRATAERLDPAGPTSIWLSGGWDSPAVFAAGEQALQECGSGERLHPVSISYPEGDPGREDELIQSVLDRWNSSTRWLDIGDIPFFDQPEARAAEREEPFAHSFEMWNRALARGSRAENAHVALDGHGGDLLFQGSLSYLADLLREGRWLTLRRDWVARGLAGSGFKGLFRLAIQPILPRWMMASLVVLRGGKPLRDLNQRPIPAWLSAASRRRCEEILHASEAEGTQRYHRFADRELFGSLTNPIGPRLLALTVGLALEEGVEGRSPLYDRRIVEFAATRPRWERSSGRETKRLLRKAMSGLLPEPFLAPRKQRTGVTGRYAATAIRETHPDLFSSAFAAPVLGELGLIDPKVLKQQWQRCLQDERGAAPLPLFYHTLQTELWLRATLGGRANSREKALLEAVAAATAGAV